jgi:hypothetical protein
VCVDPVSGLFAGANVGLSLYGASRQASASDKASNFEAMQSLLSAQIADANARMAMAEASGRMGQVDRKAEGIIGHNRADAAARGVDPNSGSPVLDAAYVAAQAEIDKRLIAAQGLNESASYRYKAAGDTRQAEQALAAAKYGTGTAWLGGLSGAVRSLSGLKWDSGGGTSGASSSGRLNLDFLWS